MKLEGYIEKPLTVMNVEAKDKKDLLDKLLRVVEKEYQLGDRKKVLEDLMIRERQSTTGIGSGIAIPHTIVETLPKTIIAYASISDGIDYQSVDRSPVKVVFLLLSPPNRVREHIKLLARIARICSSTTLVRQISNAHTIDQMISLIKREDEDHVG